MWLFMRFPIKDRGSQFPSRVLRARVGAGTASGEGEKATQDSFNAKSLISKASFNYNILPIG